MRKEIKILKALANEKRIEILQLLAKSSVLSVSDIAEDIHLHFKSTSKHLQKLVEAGLLEQKRDGLYVVHNLKEWTARLLDDITKLKV
ncbi:MAG: ArsR/SmtB family transcription factor [Patescibacteria group bacterium]